MVSHIQIIRVLEGFVSRMKGPRDTRTSVNKYIHARGDGQTQKMRGPALKILPESTYIERRQRGVPRMRLRVLVSYCSQIARLLPCLALLCASRPDTPVPRMPRHSTPCRRPTWCVVVEAEQLRRGSSRKRRQSDRGGVIGTGTQVHKVRKDGHGRVVRW